MDEEGYNVWTVYPSGFQERSWISKRQLDWIHQIIKHNNHHGVRTLILVKG